MRHIVARILALRALAPPARLAKSEGLLLPRGGGHYALYQTLLWALADAAKRADCSRPVTPHRLRHTFASEMLRLGVSLPALMQLLGHKDIRLTLRYVQVTQQDLPREFHHARQRTAQRYPVRCFPLPTAPPALGSPESVKRWPPPAISWRCTGAASPVPRRAASFHAWTGACSLSPINWITSLRPKNKERLAGQVAQIGRAHV